MANVSVQLSVKLFWICIIKKTSPQLKIAHVFYIVILLSAAVEKFLMEQVGELQVKVDHIIRLLQSRHTPESISLPMLPLASVADLEVFDAKLKANTDFRTKVVCAIGVSHKQTTFYC